VREHECVGVVLMIDTQSKSIDNQFLKCIWFWFDFIWFDFLISDMQPREGNNYVISTFTMLIDTNPLSVVDTGRGGLAGVEGMPVAGSGATPAAVGIPPIAIMDWYCQHNRTLVHIWKTVKQSKRY
jgi:hypothetical protein